MAEYLCETRSKTILEKKGIYLTLSMTKAPTPTKRIKKPTWQHKNTTKNFHYTRLPTYLGRPVGVTIAIQLV